MKSVLPHSLLRLSAISDTGDTNTQILPT